MVRGVEVKAGEFEGASGAFLDANTRVDVSGDSRLVGRKVDGVVSDDEAVDCDLAHDFERKVSVAPVSALIVISLGESGVNTNLVQPVDEFPLDIFVPTVSGVNQVASDDELLRT